MVSADRKESDEDRSYVVIGDVHGCVQSLAALLLQLEDYADRQFVFIGDYIDRGPDSKGVVDRVLQFSQHHDCVALRGNHEQMMLEAQQTGDVQLWVMNGGNTTLQSYGAPFNKLELPAQHYHFYNNTYLYYDTPNYFFTHAGLPPDVSIAEAKADEEFEDSFIWTRSHVRANRVEWEKPVIFGHTPVPQPVMKDRMINIDTGCVFSGLPDMGTLTALLLPEREVIQQPCLDQTPSL